MGEAKRRRDYERAHAVEIEADLERRRAEFARIEEIASEDPGDREDRLAHGFTLDDDWRDPAVLCRNGCGLPYAEVVAGKIRLCRGLGARRAGVRRTASVLLVAARLAATDAEGGVMGGD